MLSGSGPQRARYGVRSCLHKKRRSCWNTECIWNMKRARQPDWQWQLWQSTFANDIIPNWSHLKRKLLAHITGKSKVYLKYLDQTLKQYHQEYLCQSFAFAFLCFLASFSSNKLGFSLWQGWWLLLDLCHREQGHVSLAQNWKPQGRTQIG